MAAYLVPDVPAVRIALEHLSELEKRLREEGVSFSQEASHHLREITEAIKELDASRKTAREKLEVQTIETSKLRHQTVNLQDDIKSEISAGVNAAREDNAAELNRLRSELKTITQEIESMEKRQQFLEQENVVLSREKENVKAEYGDAIDQLNQQLSDKAGKQMLLTEKQNEIQSLKEQILQVHKALQDLREDMNQKSNTFTENRHTLQTEIEGIVVKIKEQRKINAEKRKELDIITSELQDKEETVTQCKAHMSQLERNIARLTASQIKCKEWLKVEIQKKEELHRQKEFLEQELVELAKTFEQKVENIQAQFGVIEKEMEEEQNVRNALSEPLTKLSDIFSTRRKEEDCVTAEQLSLSKRFEESKLTHEKHITSIAKCKTEINSMKEEMRQLQDIHIITADLFKKSLEELEHQLAKEKMKRVACDAEREKICQSLKTLKEEHEEHVREMTGAIELTERRHEELLEEEKKLQEHVSLSLIIEDLAEELSTTEEHGKQMETNYQDEIQQLMRDTESMTQTRLEKEQELKVHESMLEQVTTQFNTDHLRHQSLKKQTSELKTQKSNLERSIQAVTKQTASLVESKEELKRELETSRAKHVEVLTAHTAQISTTEKSIYENRVKLEQVNMENSRLHVCIEQMKQEMSDAQKDKERYTQEAKQMREQVPSLSRSLTDAWTTDMVLTEESADRDRKIMESVDRLVLKIQNRKHNISDIHSRLESQLRAMSSMILNPNYNRQEINSSSTD